MLPLALNLLYAGLLAVLSPWLLYRRLVLRKPVAGLWMKLTGRIERRHPQQPCVWFHAVSVGEVLQLQSLVAEFAAKHPRYEIVITTTTATGFDVARQKFPQHTVAYWPFDFSWAVSRALKNLSPVLVVLVELELWPNFLRAAWRQQIPVVLINGRIGERSYRGYRRVSWLWRQVLPALTRCGVQNRDYAARLIDLGVPADRVTVAGNIKYDRVQSDRRNPRTAELRQAFGIADDELVFIAGSTQAPEEEYALAAWEAARKTHPRLRLIVVPRHKERFDEVARLIEQRRLPLLRRTAAGSDSHRSTLNSQPVCLLDTLGELAACWGLADLAFVGGSLTNRGGQNMLEPAGYGAAVLFGPNTWNFPDIVEQLTGRDAAVVVHNAAQLNDAVVRLASDANLRRAIGQAAREFVQTQQGATARTLGLIEQLLPAEDQRAAA